MFRSHIGDEIEALRRQGPVVITWRSTAPCRDPRDLPDIDRSVAGEGAQLRSHGQCGGGVQRRLVVEGAGRRCLEGLVLVDGAERGVGGVAVGREADVAGESWARGQRGHSWDQCRVEIVDGVWGGDGGAVEVDLRIRNDRKGGDWRSSRGGRRVGEGVVQVVERVFS